MKQLRCQACAADAPLSYGIGVFAVLASFLFIGVAYALVGSPLSRGSQPAPFAAYLIVLVGGVGLMFLVQMVVSTLLHAWWWRTERGDRP